MRTRKIIEIKSENNQKQTQSQEETNFYFKNAFYKKLYKMQVEYENGMTEEILFGWKSSELKVENPDIMGYNLERMVGEKIHTKIYLFCQIYGSLLLTGKTIETVVEEDPYNLLNYEPLIKEEVSLSYILRKTVFRKKWPKRQIR